MQLQSTISRRTHKTDYKHNYSINVYLQMAQFDSVKRIKFLSIFTLLSIKNKQTIYGMPRHSICQRKIYKCIFVISSEIWDNNVIELKCHFKYSYFKLCAQLKFERLQCSFNKKIVLTGNKMCWTWVNESMGYCIDWNYAFDVILNEFSHKILKFME